MKTKLVFSWLLTIFFFAGGFGLTACSVDGVMPVGITRTPTLSPTPITPSASPTATATVTPVPSPTPIPAVRIESGEQALFHGHWDLALQEFQAALEGSRSDPDVTTAALLGLGRTQALAGDYHTALDHLRRLVDDFPDSPHRAEAFFFMAQVYHTLSRFTEAAEAYQRYLALRPGLIDAYVLELRGDALMSAGDYPSALVDYQAALGSPRTGDRTELQVKVAKAYAVTGDYSTALIMYEDIYNRTTSDAYKSQMDLLKGQIYLALGQTEQAYAAYLDAVENYPLAYSSYLALVELVEAGYPVNELDRGLVDYYADEPGVAVAAFDRYLQGSPSDPATAYHYKGLALAELTNYSSAIDQWNIVIENFPAASVWASAWEEKAYTLWAELGDYSGAVQTLVRFAEVAPGSPRAAEFLYDAARIAERDEELETAASLWERVWADYPASEQAFQSLFLAGITRYRMDDYAGAQSLFERLLAGSTDITQRATAYFWIGKTLDTRGENAAARESWGRAAAVDPTGYYSERARDILMGRDPFSPPKAFDPSFDRLVEKAEADEWMRQSFALPPETNLAGLGPLAGDGRVVRGSELWRLGQYVEARAEFEDLRTAYLQDPANTYRLAGYLNEIGLYRSSILAARQVLNLAGMDDAATMRAPRYFNHIRFGIYYPELVFPLAREHNFHPLLLLSLIRQESLFEPFAHSSAAARGLMQVIPPTGQSIHDSLGWPPNYTTADLNRPLVSVTFGSEYLESQYNYLDGDMYAALAAYNGGPGNSQAWKNLAPDDPDLFLEVIRFEETRRYIRNIYEIFTIYRRLYDRTP